MTRRKARRAPALRNAGSRSASPSARRSSPLIVIVGSIKAGIDWGVEGPRAGILPVLRRARDPDRERRQPFQAHAQSRPGTGLRTGDSFARCLSVVVPTAIYVAIIPWIGIYVSSLLLIAFFMKRLGNYGWHLIAAIAAWRADPHVPRVRKVVPRALAQGPGRGLAWILGVHFDSAVRWGCRDK